MQTVKGFWHGLNGLVSFIERWTLTVLFVGMIICGALQIIARFILQSPIAWSEELLTYSFVWTSFLGAGLAINSLSHFNVDLLIVRMPARFSHPLLYIVWIIMLLFTIFLTWKGAILARLNMGQMMDVIPISMMWAYLALPVSAIFMFVHVVERLFTGDFLPQAKILPAVNCTE